VPFIDLEASPLAAGISPVRIHYRDAGSGSPVVFLHSGWGYEIYPFDRQMPAVASRHRVVAPDRSGYGQSTPIRSLPRDFHTRAAAETRAVIAALGLDRPVLWGHSDGAIIALLLALETPALVSGVIAEATHFYRRKPRSREFFAAMIDDEQPLSDGVTAVLAGDHGAQWRGVIERHSLAWERIDEEAVSDTDDFYGGRLADIVVPTLVIHGARDPRTEPGEIEAVESVFNSVRGVRLQPDLEGPPKGRLSVRRVMVLPAGGHSPHSEPATAGDVSRIALDFIDGIRA
jgi:pimeloyl-ACP methyl ester carboxylesterase